MYKSIFFIFSNRLFFSSDPAISQMVHPHQKLVGYDEEASVLHQRLVMILQGWLLLNYASAFLYTKLAVLGAVQC